MKVGSLEKSRMKYWSSHFIRSSKMQAKHFKLFQKMKAYEIFLHSCVLFFLLLYGPNLGSMLSNYFTKKIDLKNLSLLTIFQGPNCHNCTEVFRALRFEVEIVYNANNVLKIIISTFGPNINEKDSGRLK